MQTTEKSLPAAAPLAQGASQEITQQTNDAASAPDITTVIAIIIVSIAIVGMIYSSYKIRKMREVKIKLK